MTGTNRPGRVIVERDDDVLTLTIDNPSRRNALSYQMYAVLQESFAQAAEDPALTAVVLRGAGGHFAGGTDITELGSITSGELGVEYEHYMARVQEALLALRVPVIAIVDGACVGGGMVLAALSDIVYCTPHARFGSPIARTLGNTLSATSLARMYALLGRRLASRMLLTAELIDAEVAERSGFVTAVLPQPEIESTLDTTVDAIRGCSPETIWSIKELERRMDHHLAEIPVDDVYDRIYGGPDFREGLSAFLGKRTPSFRNRP
jgi:enoyl-CoA hydratase/carnithine racemase